MDERIKRAQQLYNEIEVALRDVDAKRIEAAWLHEAIAVEALNRGDVCGWIDMYAAITLYADAGRSGAAERLCDTGEAMARTIGAGYSAVHTEIWRLRHHIANVKKVRKSY